jgi:hypothetical protein
MPTVQEGAASYDPVAHYKKTLCWMFELCWRLQGSCATAAKGLNYNYGQNVPHMRLANGESCFCERQKAVENLYKHALSFKKQGIM